MKCASCEAEGEFEQPPLNDGVPSVVCVVVGKCLDEEEAAARKVRAKTFPGGKTRAERGENAKTSHKRQHQNREEERRVGGSNLAKIEGTDDPDPLYLSTVTSLSLSLTC